MLLKHGFEKRIGRFYVLPALTQNGNIAGQQLQFCINFHFTARDGLLKFLRGSRSIVGFFVVIHHRENERRVVGIDEFSLIVICQCFFRLIVLQVQIAHQKFVTDIIGILVDNGLNFFERPLLFIHHVVQPELVERYGIGNSGVFLQGVERLNGFVEFAVIAIHIGKLKVKFHLIGIGFQQIIVNIDNFFFQIKFFAQSGKDHVVVIVFGVVFHRFAEIIERRVLLFQRTVICSQLHQHTGVGGIDGMTVLKQIESLVVLAQGFGIYGFVEVIIEFPSGGFV